MFTFFFSSRRRHTRCYRDWSSDVCSSDLNYWLLRITYHPHNTLSVTSSDRFFAISFRANSFEVLVVITLLLTLYSELLIISFSQIILFIFCLVILRCVVT